MITSNGLKQIVSDDSLLFCCLAVIFFKKTYISRESLNNTNYRDYLCGKSFTFNYKNMNIPERIVSKGNMSIKLAYYADHAEEYAGLYVDGY